MLQGKRQSIVIKPNTELLDLYLEHDHRGSMLSRPSNNRFGRGLIVRCGGW